VCDLFVELRLKHPEGPLTLVLDNAGMSDRSLETVDSC
jgi:hypothetical protein